MCIFIFLISILFYKDKNFFYSTKSFVKKIETCIWIVAYLNFVIQR
jgi:hypothetical protein